MQNIIDVIRNKVSLLEFISKETVLTLKGREYSGCCPFHKEKSASFFVNENKGFYYCFGCGAKGNIFTFLTSYYNMSFRQALEKLADHTGVKLPEKFVFNKEYENNNILYNICKDFSNYSIQQLNKSNNVCNYLKNRGINREIREKFLLGYVGNYEDFNKNLYNEEDLLELGLYSYNSKGKVYPFFKNRLIFPIQNTSGKIIAFGGRVLDDTLPKYLNSKESKVFTKRNVVYGLYQSLPNITSNRPLIVVEGYMDVISLHQEGIKTAVAALGTSITEDHIKELHKYTTTPIFCLDGDASGQKATYRVVDLYLKILKPGINPKFVILPENEDPDSFIRKNSVKDYDELLKKAMSISELLYYKESYGVNLKIPENRAEVLSKLEVLVHNIPSYEIKRDMMRYFKNELYNSTFVKKGFSEGNKLNKEKINLTEKRDIAYERLQLLLAIVLQHPYIYNDIEEEFIEIDFLNKDLNLLKEFLIGNIDKLRTTEGLLKEMSKNANLLRINEELNHNKMIFTLLSTINNKIQALNVFGDIYKLFKIETLKVEENKVHNTLNNLYQQIKANPADEENYKKKIQLYFEQYKQIKKEINRLLGID